jgi:glycerophosphoryl diester phosphodiesterase
LARPLTVEILAHRGNRHGPDPAGENTLATVRACLERGWGVETDIRRDAAGRFYIAHDPAPWTPANDADAFCTLWRAHAGTIALNMKELGYEAELVAYLAAQAVRATLFLFDMELIEPVAGETARQLRRLDAELALAARVSDRGESIARALDITVASVIWLDEFDGPWATEGDIARLKFAGKTVYAVSPELHGGGRDVAVRRWREFAAWGVDGICTDYALDLAAWLEGQGRVG